MTENHPTSRPVHDYLPAAGRDALLPFYDLMSLVLGAGEVHERLLAEATPCGPRILEIGCGTGNLLVRAARGASDLTVVGCDPDPRAVDRARRKVRRLPGVRVDVAYAQRLPYPDASFDTVLSALMWHHLDGEAKTAAAAEVARVLRPGGSLYLADLLEHGHGGTRGGTHGHGRRGHGLHAAFSRRITEAGHRVDDAGIVESLAGAGLRATRLGEARLRVGTVGCFRADRT
ncbi:class I SAM-dependent methyltransferase [Tsukamurella soli]